MLSDVIVIARVRFIDGVKFQEIAAWDFIHNSGRYGFECRFAILLSVGALETRAMSSADLV